MDYYLTNAINGTGFTLHKDACKKVLLTERRFYLGYYFGEYNAIQEAKRVTSGMVVLCSECMKKPQ